MIIRKSIVWAAVLIAVINPVFSAEEPAANIPWANYLIPLPQEMAVSSTVRIAPDQISFVTPSDASAMVTQAVAELRTAYQKKGECNPAGNDFIIHIGKLAADGRVNGQAVEGAERLKQAPHSDQAYLIRPVGSNALVVAGLNDKGVFYGIQTLAQLLTAKLTKTEAVIPMAVITDWPDMDERGVWNVGYSTPGFIPWMAALKLNYTLLQSGPILKKGEPAQCPPLPMDLIRQATHCAFHLVPHPRHYDFWFSYGDTNLYPELVGKGESARHPDYFRYPQNEQYHKSLENIRCPCASNPKFQELVADWVRSAAEQGVREVGLWLTELYPCQCACEKCMQDGPHQYVLETKASIAAIKQVQRDYGDLIGRIFIDLTAQTEKEVQDTYACLAMVPPTGVRVEIVFTPNKAFADFAAKGRWLSTYNGPRLVPGPSSGGGLFRFGVATPMLISVGKYYTNHFSALYCMGQVYVPADIGGNYQKIFGNYQLHALAEWTWNVKGRAPAAFAEAWAIRQGLPAPDRFAAWIGIMEPLEIKVSALNCDDILGKSLKAISAKQPLPAKFPKPELLTNSLAECARAIPLARACGDPSLMEETLLLQTCFQAFSQLADLHKQIFGATEKPLDRKDVERSVQAIKDSLNASVRHLEKIMALSGIDAKAGPDFVMDRYARQIKVLTEQLDAVASSFGREP